MILKAQSPTQLDNDPTSMNTGHKKTVSLDLCTNCANKHAYNKYAHSIAVAVFFPYMLSLKVVGVAVSHLFKPQSLHYRFTRPYKTVTPK